MSRERVSTCLAGPYTVSFTTGGGKPGAILNSKLHNPDEPNEFGGHGTITPHPVHDGLWFASVDEGRVYAIAVGLLKAYVHRPYTTA